MNNNGLPLGIVPIALYAVGTFLGMLLMLELGRLVGRRGLAKHGGQSHSTSPVDGAIFALLGLLIAFTFSGAAARFDTRRLQIATEANHIGTSWLRLDLLPADYRHELRGLFRQYLDARLDTYRKLPDVNAALAELARSQELQRQIWSKAVAGCDARADPSVRTLLLGSINEMIDITTTRTMAARIHPPTVIFLLLTCMTLGCSFLAGHAMAGHPGRPWVHHLVFAIVISSVTYTILDIEHPRAGVIRISAADQVLEELRHEMDLPD
ncbi:MAG TPA: DUF4239 domain-containing protein [Candidatus Eisenbacteria bacterium]